jgi:rhodanese-related sulfurtransferase
MIRTLAAALAIFVSMAACGADAPKISQDALVERMTAADAGLVVLDVRTPQEFAEGHVPGAVNIPHEELEVRLGELESVRGGDVVVYCRSGRRSEIALSVLEKAGFSRRFHLEGDFQAWSAAKRPVER